jgi:nucleoside-diphosphate-sugar epimerase
MGTYLVTGGAGFIGSHLVDYLVQRGDAVRVLDDFSTGKEENIRHNLGKIELIRGSITDRDTVEESIKGVDFVLHHAAVASVPRSIDDPIRSSEIGIGGTLNLLVAARDAGVKRFVYASSSAVYGDPAILPVNEDTPADPLSPYGVTKLANEYYCRLFTRLYGLETVCLRYFNVFGPRQEPESDYAAVISKFISSMIRGVRPIIYGDGIQSSRDYTYVDNNVRACMLACSVPEAAGEVFNIASGESTTPLDLVESLSEILGVPVSPEFTDFRPGEIRHSSTEIDKARRILGFHPVTGFREGLANTVAWFVADYERQTGSSEERVKACHS